MKLTTHRLLLSFGALIAFVDALPCDSLACERGSCNENGTECNCDYGYGGLLCDWSMCDPNPCENRNAKGVCKINNDNSDYECLCPGNWRGRNCSVNHNPCFTFGVACQNDGKCRNVESADRWTLDYSWVCDCASGYAGPHCEHEIDLCHTGENGEPFCKNGGECSQKRYCTCPDGFGGVRCELPVPLYASFKQLGCFPDQPAACAIRFGNGECDEMCATPACLYDGFDCINENTQCRERLRCTSALGNGKCDAECNSAECGWDGGDCELGPDRVPLSQSSVASSSPVLLSVALAVPPTEALARLASLKADIAMRLSSRVMVARDDVGPLVMEWDPSGEQAGGETDRVDMDRPENSMSLGTVVVLEVDTRQCLDKRKVDKHVRCFETIAQAVTYLSAWLSSERVSGGGSGGGNTTALSLPIHGFNQYNNANAKTMSLFRLPLWLLIAAVVLSLVAASFCCAGVILFQRRAKKSTKPHSLWAPVWNIPKEMEYEPPTPPYGLDDLPPPPSSVSQTARAIRAMHMKRDDVYAEFAASPLLRAVRRGLTDTAVRIVHAAKTDGDGRVTRQEEEGWRDAVGNGPLHHAVACDDAQMIDALIHTGKVDLCCLNDGGQSPLVYCARISHAGSVDAARLLIDALAAAREASGCDRLGDNAHDAPFQTGHAGPLGDELTVDESWGLLDDRGRSALHYASQLNNVRLMEVLLHAGASPSLHDNDGNTPLHLAAREGRADAVGVLIGAGALLKAENLDGHTPTQMAAASGHEALARLLTARGMQGSVRKPGKRVYRLREVDENGNGLGVTGGGISKPDAMQRCDSAASAHRAAAGTPAHASTPCTPRGPRMRCATPARDWTATANLPVAAVSPQIRKSSEEPYGNRLVVPLACGAPSVYSSHGMLSPAASPTRMDMDVEKGAGGQDACANSDGFPPRCASVSELVESASDRGCNSPYGQYAGGGRGVHRQPSILTPPAVVLGLQDVRRLECGGGRAPSAHSSVRDSPSPFRSVLDMSMLSSQDDDTYATLNTSHMSTFKP